LFKNSLISCTISQIAGRHLQLSARGAHPSDGHTAYESNPSEWRRTGLTANTWFPRGNNPPGWPKSPRGPPA